MPRHRRLPRWLVACLVAVVGAAALVVPAVPAAHAVGADDSIVGPSRVTATQMAAWFRSHTSSPYRAGVPLDQLTWFYISEGNLAGVRGDIAFAQSVLETRWFSFPAGGLLTPAQNNFAGIGACDSCATGTTFATVQLGIRAQMQQLRRYADPGSRSTNIGASPVRALWPTDAAYDVMNRTHGWAPTWQSLSGTWASAPSYAASINQLYNSLWNSAGQPGAIHWSVWEMPGGTSGPTGSSIAGGLAAGPAIASWQPNRLDVFATSIARCARPQVVERAELVRRLGEPLHPAHRPARRESRRGLVGSEPRRRLRAWHGRPALDPGLGRGAMERMDPARRGARVGARGRVAGPQPARRRRERDGSTALAHDVLGHRVVRMVAARRRRGGQPGRDLCRRGTRGPVRARHRRRPVPPARGTAAPGPRGSRSAESSPRRRRRRRGVRTGSTCS